MEGHFYFFENLALFQEGESGVELVAVTLPSPPALDHVAGDEIREHAQCARDACPKAVTCDGVHARGTEVGEEGCQSLVQESPGQVFTRTEPENRKRLVSIA